MNIEETKKAIEVMTDKELLELAAKAAGIEEGIGGAFWTEFGVFDPLTDDGDALRLAVNLRLTVSWDRFNDDDYATATPLYTHQGYDCIVGDNPYAATRRAIVRAAAAIGEMK